MIIRNGIVVQDGALLIRPLLLTLVLGAVYFGSRKFRKGGISPILLIFLSAVAGIAAYGL
jgi:chromate transporter